ncbi:HD domain-containing protein [Clohesyomyces aquaticus]|uniref:5'-deoxynucleotidase n=1 Tax=Clohesyomyces aquaticus TaxID=1231657 RepID=A0A1Y1YV41_9PLEO|nr:HD domain-containing protein [Clohesyomyces aquaticus]
MEQDLPNPPSSVEESPLPFLHLMSILKHVPRTGWLRTVSRPESVAAHTYRLAVICMLAPKPLNQERCIYLALCHDMAESVVGDIPTYAGVAKDTKHELEESGIHYIKDLLKTSHPSTSEKINEAWQEYEAGSTAEARWVREMDKFECLLQASEYERMTHGEKDLEEFQGLSRKIHSPIGIAWAMLLQQEREACVRKRRERVPIIFVVGTSTKLVLDKVYCADRTRLC